MSHAFRLASVIAAGVISFATAAAADSADLDQRLQTRLDQLLEARLDPLVEAMLDAQTASLFAREETRLAREETRLDALVEAKLSELLEAEPDSQTAERLARNPEPAAGDRIPAIAGSANLATRMTRAVSDSGTLGCVAELSDEVQRPTVVSSRPPLSPNPIARC